MYVKLFGTTSDYVCLTPQYEYLYEAMKVSFNGWSHWVRTLIIQSSDYVFSLWLF